MPSELANCHSCWPRRYVYDQSESRLSRVIRLNKKLRKRLELVRMAPGSAGLIVSRLTGLPSDRGRVDASDGVGVSARRPSCGTVRSRVPDAVLWSANSRILPSIAPFWGPCSVDAMSGSHKSIGRRLVGRPRIWKGSAWSAIGFGWLSLAVSDTTGGNSEVLRYVLAGAFLAMGLSSLIVALHDWRTGRGAYRERTVEPRHQS